MEAETYNGVKCPACGIFSDDPIKCSTCGGEKVKRPKKVRRIAVLKCRHCKEWKPEAVFFRPAVLKPPRCRACLIKMLRAVTPTQIR
jgi:hypothetical protein